MNKFVILALVAAATPFAAHAAASNSSTVRSEAGTPVQVHAGQMLYSGGNRLAPIYRIASDGSPQVVLDGKLVTVPASSLSNAGGRVTTSLTKKDINKAQ